MSRPTKTLIGDRARKAVLEGVRSIYIPVQTTLGPQGRGALLYRSFNRGSRVTDDGYTVAECQEPKDVHVRLVATAFKEACKRTNEKIGDGTTTTATIGGRLMEDCYKLLSDSEAEIGNANTATSHKKLGVMTLKRQLLQSAEKVKVAIKESALEIKTLKDLEKVATVSIKDEELGKVVAKMAWEVGVDGFIDVVEGFKGEIETEVIKGMRFPAKVAAKRFVNNPARYEMVVQDAPVVVTNFAIDSIASIGAFTKDLKTSKIIIVAPSFTDDVLIGFVKSAEKNGFFLHPVAVPSLRTEQFEDLAIYCGATFIDKNQGKKLENIKESDLGFLEKLVVKDVEAKEDATAVGGKGAVQSVQTVYEKVKVQKRRGKDTLEVEEPIAKQKLTSAVAERIETLKGQLKETQAEQFKKLLERRIASMGSAVGVIRVADSTQASALFKKLKIEDGVYACKAAIRGGYVKGGGVCLRDIAESLNEDDVLKNALIEPYKLIQRSFGEPTEIDEDVLDPAEAVLYSVEHAVGVVSNLITVETITQEIEDFTYGEGELAIARALNEIVISDKIHKGQLKASEAEKERDELNGLTKDEFEYLDKIDKLP